MERISIAGRIDTPIKSQFQQEISFDLVNRDCRQKTIVCGFLAQVSDLYQDRKVKIYGRLKDEALVCEALIIDPLKETEVDN